MFLSFALDHPELLSSMRILEPMGLDFHNDDLDDYSVAGTLRDVARGVDNLEMLRRYDRDSLEDPLSYKELAGQTVIVIEATVYPAYRRLIDHYAALEPTA